MYETPLNALRAFAAIVSEGGVRPAARGLGVSHSAVSRHLKELEVWLGADLLDRNRDGHGLQLTVQGKALGDAAVRLLSEVSHVAEGLREQRAKNAVLIDTTPSFAARWLLPNLPAFEEREPWIKVSILVDQRPRSPDSMRCDLAIRMGKKPEAGTTAFQLMSDRLLPLASPRYWEAHTKPSTPFDLAGHTLLHDRDPNAAWSLWKAAFGPSELDVQSGRRFSSSDLLLRAAEQGMGVALSHYQLARESLEAGLLEPAFPDVNLPLTGGYWVIPAQRRASLAAETFMAWLMSAVDVPSDPATPPSPTSE